MTQRRKSTPEDDWLIQDESADSVERASAISRIAADKVFGLETALAKLLRQALPEKSKLRLYVGDARQP